MNQNTDPFPIPRGALSPDGVTAAERHECPGAGCTVTLPFNKFACQRHWFSLPPEVRARVSSTWRSQDLPAYLEAREEAVALLMGTAR